MNARVEPLRAGLAILTTLGLVVAMLMVLTGPAGANHINSTGQVQGNCVEFQGGKTKEAGAKSPADFSSVIITLVSWNELDGEGEPHGLTFSVSGLATNQFVDISVKSGTDVEELGPYGNGTHTISSGDLESDHAISHVRLCVFVTTTETTTTTTEATTTTTEATTTTTGAPTTTVGSAPTTTVEVLGTVITQTTVAAEVAGTQVLAEELPFTGPETGWLLPAAVLLLLSGLMITGLAGNSRED